MACATPIISTNCLYGPLEIIHNATNYISKRKDTIYGKYGVLTPVFSFGKSREASTYEEKEMAKAVCTLLGNSKLRQKYSELSKKRSEDFTVQKMVDQYNIVIRRLL
jgi:N-acetylgalactosamine-N,N'-diacetylbacillosaminyl-diphospho-undecaprenol 4-alpha-N-acetylgalactosaminyltransferase